MGRRVIDGPDRSRLLIDVPTGILIDCRSKDITFAIGLVNSSSFTGTHIISSFIIHMSTVFTSIFNNEARAEGSRSVRAARGSGRHCSMLDHVQARAACRAAIRREVTPFDFNIGRYHVSPFLRCCVATARLIFNLRSLGLRKVSRIWRHKTSTSDHRRLGPRKGLRTYTGMTSLWWRAVLLVGSWSGWRPVHTSVLSFVGGLPKR